MTNIRPDKGALVRVAMPDVVQKVLAFPYNPETVHHALRSDALAGPTSAGADAGFASGIGSTAAAAKVSELLRFTLVLDRADAMEDPNRDPQGLQLGLHPVLSALEVWLREDAQPLGNAVSLLVWGAHRVLPVRLVGLEVHERLFDANLNPLHASAHLTLLALDGTEAGAGSWAARKFQAHQAALVQMAQTALTANLAPTGLAPGAL